MSIDFTKDATYIYKPDRVVEPISYANWEGDCDEADACLIRWRYKDSPEQHISGKLTITQVVSATDTSDKCNP